MHTYTNLCIRAARGVYGFVCTFVWLHREDSKAPTTDSQWVWASLRPIALLPGCSLVWVGAAILSLKEFWSQSSFFSDECKLFSACFQWIGWDSTQLKRGAALFKVYCLYCWSPLKTTFTETFRLEFDQTTGHHTLAKLAHTILHQHPLKAWLLSKFPSCDCDLKNKILWQK